VLLLVLALGQEVRAEPRRQWLGANLALAQGCVALLLLLARAACEVWGPRVLGHHAAGAASCADVVAAAAAAAARLLVRHSQVMSVHLAPTPAVLLQVWSTCHARCTAWQPAGCLLLLLLLLPHPVGHVLLLLLPLLPQAKARLLLLLLLPPVPAQPTAKG
jgi:hypothetical protein